MLSDTLGHRILLIDDKMKVCSEIACGTQWLQEAICTSSGTYLTLENVHIDQFPESCLNNRLTEIDAAGTEMVTLEVAADYRLFGACEINEALARDLTLAWGKTGDIEALRPSTKVGERFFGSSWKEQRDVRI